MTKRTVPAFDPSLYGVGPEIRWEEWEVIYAKPLSILLRHRVTGAERAYQRPIDPADDPRRRWPE